MRKFIRNLVQSIQGLRILEKDLKESGAWGQPPEHPNCQRGTNINDIIQAYITGEKPLDVLEAKSPAARGKLAAPTFYAILEAARLHGIRPIGAESLGEQGTKEGKEAQ